MVLVVRDRDKLALLDTQLLQRLFRVVLKVLRLPKQPRSLLHTDKPFERDRLPLADQLADKLAQRRILNDLDGDIDDAADRTVRVRRTERRDVEDALRGPLEPDGAGGRPVGAEDVERLVNECGSNDGIRSCDGGNDVAGVL